MRCTSSRTFDGCHISISGVDEGSVQQQAFVKGCAVLYTSRVLSIAASLILSLSIPKVVPIQELVAPEFK